MCVPGMTAGSVPDTWEIARCNSTWVAGSDDKHVAMPSWRNDVFALLATPLALLGAWSLAACGSEPTADASMPATTEVDSATAGSPPDGERCRVRLHGKGSTGGDPQVFDDVIELYPTGNEEGWGQRQWLYFPDDRYEEARDIVDEAVADCGVVILYGHSNGAAFAAKLYCRGETFDGRLVQVVVDDPVPDAAVEGCEPDPAVAVTLYWTGALESTARSGWDCAEGDWTCEGGETIGIDAYAEALGVAVTPSVMTDHTPYWDAPEVDQWEPVTPATTEPTA
jgi:hypothetical protein